MFSGKSCQTEGGLMFLNKRELYPFPNYMTIGNSVTCLRDHASEEICTSTLWAACLFMTI